MAKLTKTSLPGVYRRHVKGCDGSARCQCSYVVVSEHRGKQTTETVATFAEARERKGAQHAGDRRPTSKVRFRAYFEGWIKSYGGRTSRGFSETTRPEYERPIRSHAVGRWGGWKLAEVEAADVRELFGELRAEGCSTSQIKKLRAALSVMFATAVDDGLVRSNPVQGVRIPAERDEGEPEEERAKALTRAELALLMAAIPEDWTLFFEFLTVTGLRISEALGLRWEHLDLGESPRVMVREQFYRGKRRKLKSGAGRRDLPLAPDMSGRLLAYRRDTYRGPKTPVFASKTGTELIRGKIAERVLTPAAIAAGFKREEAVIGADGREATKVRPTVTFHTFRHTCASLLFDDGRNIKQVQEWLGHADPGFTLRTYVHLMDAGVGRGLDLPSQVKAGSRRGAKIAADGDAGESLRSAI
ncbi:MAG TPA: site-specific integrase [Solirubrobacterales bacterium]